MVTATPNVDMDFDAPLVAPLAADGAPRLADQPGEPFHQTRRAMTIPR
jgi:hypothetical protein